jgi:EAL domain-containing protein (putative c-di-GMP-specific phosphodiesterase class I)
MVAAIISLGHSLRVKVIAEGIETEEQFAYLRRCGCDEVQGYLTGHPVPGQNFERKLTRDELS